MSAICLLAQVKSRVDHAAGPLILLLLSLAGRLLNQEVALHCIGRQLLCSRDAVWREREFPMYACHICAAAN